MSVKKWTKLIKEQETSGKSVASWCREHQISYSEFMYHVKRLPLVKISKGPFIEQHEDTLNQTWIEITTIGARLTLSRKFNKQALIRLLETLKKL